jgi:hypothetical protein
MCVHAFVACASIICSNNNNNKSRTKKKANLTRDVIDKRTVASVTVDFTRRRPEIVQVGVSKRAAVCVCVCVCEGAQ